MADKPKLELVEVPASEYTRSHKFLGKPRKIRRYVKLPNGLVAIECEPEAETMIVTRAPKSQEEE